MKKQAIFVISNTLKLTIIAENLGKKSKKCHIYICRYAFYYSIRQFQTYNSNTEKAFRILQIVKIQEFTLKINYTKKMRKKTGKKSKRQIDFDFQFYIIIWCKFQKNQTVNKKKLKRWVGSLKSSL